MNATRELRWLPEDPSQMTWRGRYTHVYRFVAELLKFVDWEEDSSISILDIGCGIAPFGSPTLHDFWEFLERRFLQPAITGVDPVFPPELGARHPITYQHEVAQVSGKFDIVCMLHVVEHVSYRIYSDLRMQALQRLRRPWRNCGMNRTTWLSATSS